MTTLTINATGNAAPDTAWERYADTTQWPQWAPQITGVDASARRIAPGVTGRVFGPLGVPAAFSIDAVDEAARRWTWTVRVGLVRVQLQHAVRARAGGSSTSLTITGLLPVVIGYAPLARLALGRLVAR